MAASSRDVASAILGKEHTHDSDNAEDMSPTHKVWGRIEVDSSCSARSYERKVDMITKHFHNISIVSSSSVTDSNGQQGQAAGAQDNADGGSEEGDEAVEEDQAVATRGSALHSQGECKPCHFYRAGNICRHGANCDFCHYHSDLRRKRPGKVRRAKIKARKQREAEAAAAELPEANDAQPARTRAIMSL